MRKWAQKEGFTIVELLIVVVVIAILAAIAIVSYNGVTSRAIETSMQSDLRVSSKLLELDKTRSGAYPAAIGDANQGLGLTPSGNNVFSYDQKSYGYCLFVTNARSTKSFQIQSRTGQISEGACEVAVSTFAGSGTQGYLDGPGTSAQFYRLQGVDVDNDGTVYVADYLNQRIRKVAPDGTVSTLAGSGTAGFQDGTGVAAQFNAPTAVAVDGAGNVYVADYNNNRIRKISPAGVVTTLAGSGSTGSNDGTGASARFYNPHGIAVDGDGVVYVSDYTNNRIRKISPAGVVTTLAGSGTAGTLDGTGVAAQFNRPIGLDVDDAGSVYVAEYSGNVVRKISPTGVVTTLAGSGTAGFLDGTGAAARFSTPNDVAVDRAGTVYVADYNNNRIRKITSAGVVTTIAGTGSTSFQDGPGPTAQFMRPAGITIDGSGSLYVGDSYSQRVRKITQ